MLTFGSVCACIPNGIGPAGMYGPPAHATTERMQLRHTAWRLSTKRSVS